MKKIPLTQGQVTIVDDDVFEEVGRFKWYAHWHPCVRNYYGRRNNRLGGRWKTIILHRFIAELKIGRPLKHKERIDHISHDTLDNRWENLRDETEAAHAYDAKALELFGEHAWLNFPQETP